MYDKELYTASKCRGTFNLFLGESANKSAVAMCQPLSRQSGVMLPCLCGAAKGGVRPISEDAWGSRSVHIKREIALFEGYVPM